MNSRQILTCFAVLCISAGAAVGDEALARRQAQNLAAVCAAAQAAGHDFVAENVCETIKNIVEGAVVQDGPFKGTLFIYSKISEEQQEAARRFLELQHGMLIYDEDG